MSPSIWTRCGGRANRRRLGGRVWRVVEGQHVVSTRKLVDNLEEQEILEDLIESSKPPVPSGKEFEGLHYLLATPFRYPPLRHGSRFATRAERSLWYGSARPRTAFAETAYYRLVFLEGTAADLGTVVVELSLFHVRVRTTKGVDLTRAPFDRYRDAIASPDSYEATQRLGREMRDDDVAALRYPSARDVRGGPNLALFTPAAFAEKRPEDSPQNWHCVASTGLVEMSKKDFFEKKTFAFPRSDFLVDGKLPAPAP
ncbi:MAG: RES family NAD+ phosphorylase [Acidobacteriota bacterium]|nr:RES family NAD+ phosphorylase [Acidobacteriota bacterium]